MKKPGPNRKMGVPDGGGGFKLRVYHRKGRKALSPRCLIKCGCCENSVEIYYDDLGLEINGVNGSTSEWRKIFGPLLKLDKKASRSHERGRERSRS